MYNRLNISLCLFLRSMLICGVTVVFFASSVVVHASSQTSNSFSSADNYQPTSPFTSPNWSDILALPPTSYTFTAVSATFVVPCGVSDFNPNPNQSTPDAQVSFWVGLGGYQIGNNAIPPLVQTVIVADAKSGQPAIYYAVGEVNTGPLPQDDHQVPLIGTPDKGGLACGHQYSLTVATNSSSDTFAIQDRTLGTPAISKPGGSTWPLLPHGAPTAEWIAERPYDYNVGSFDALADFGTVDFSNCKARLSSNFIQPLANLRYP